MMLRPLKRPKVPPEIVENLDGYQNASLKYTPTDSAQHVWQCEFFVLHNFLDLWFWELERHLCNVVCEHVLADVSGQLPLDAKPFLKFSEALLGCHICRLQFVQVVKICLHVPRCLPE